MQLANYIGKSLKSDAVIRLLERFDMKVIYDFDRLHENTPDSYRSSAKDGGFEIHFNEQQVLDTIWCYVLPRSGFSAIDEEVGTPVFRTFADAKTYAREADLTTSESSDGCSWIKLEYENMWIHYEFSDNQLALITLMLK